MCGKAEPVARAVDTVEFGSSASASASSSPVLQARSKSDSITDCITAVRSSVTITTASSTPNFGNFDQSSLGSDDSGICCSLVSGNQLRLARSTEYFEDDDVMMQFEECKSLESEEMEPSSVDQASELRSVESNEVTGSALSSDRYVYTTASCSLIYLESRCRNLKQNFLFFVQE